MRLPTAEFIDALTVACGATSFVPTDKSARHEGHTCRSQRMVSGGQWWKHEQRHNKHRRVTRAPTTRTQSAKLLAHANRHTKRLPDVDPTHAKLLATLSRAVAVPEAAAPKPKVVRTPPDTSSYEGTRHSTSTEPQDAHFSRQADSSAAPTQHRPPGGNIQSNPGEDHAMGFRPPPRPFAHPQKCPVQ